MSYLVSPSQRGIQAWFPQRNFRPVSIMTIQINGATLTGGEQLGIWDDLVLCAERLGRGRNPTPMHMSVFQLSRDQEAHLSTKITELNVGEQEAGTRYRYGLERMPAAIHPPEMQLRAIVRRQRRWL